MLRGLKEQDLQSKAAKALKACLADVPFARIGAVETPPAPGGPDMVARIRLPRGEQTLLVEFRTSGQPRLARQAVNQLRRCLSEKGGAYGVFMAPYVSPQSAEICEKEGIGFVDLAGNCKLCFGQVYIRRTGIENPYSEKRALRTLYSPKAARVLRVLLSEPRRPWKVQDLAREARVSLGQVSNVKKLLDDREWIRSGERGFCLSDPGALLAEWAENQRYRRDRTYACYSLRSGTQFESRLAETCDRLGVRYALTGFSAAARLAPMVRNPRMAAYVATDAQRLMEGLQLKAVSSGANLSLIEPGDDGVFYKAEQFEGIMIVSPVQAYLDLKRQGGRGEEAAQAILRKVLRDR